MAQLVIAGNHNDPHNRKFEAWLLSDKHNDKLIRVPASDIKTVASSQPPKESIRALVRQLLRDIDSTTPAPQLHVAQSESASEPLAKTEQPDTPTSRQRLARAAKGKGECKDAEIKQRHHARAKRAGTRAQSESGRAQRVQAQRAQAQRAQTAPRAPNARRCKKSCPRWTHLLRTRARNRLSNK